MADIRTGNGFSVFRLSRWLGLNESPDGDTGLKPGEASVMRNFRVTREGHLQIRPGYAALCTLAQGSPVRGLWSGYVNGTFHLLAACAGKVWDIDRTTWTALPVGGIDDAPTHFFGFGQKVYILTGTEYYVWDGDAEVCAVEGYVPVVITDCPPEGGGMALERANLLTGKRRVRFSPDGTATVFYLPEAGIDEVLGVEGADIPWSADKAAGTLTFETAPAEGVSTVTVTYRKGSGNRPKVTAMGFSEFYNGCTDTRVFLYGDGTNETVYSDLDDDGQPNAEYFPEMNTMAVDSANTPVTAMIRHYDRLLVFKTDSAYTVQYDTLNLSGTVTAAFYCTPLNREVGCAGYGQVRLVENNPRTLHESAVYEWVLSGSGSRDERNARRISARVESTLSRFAAADCMSFDDAHTQEFYVVCGDEAVIHNYGNDTWYCYDRFPALCMQRVEGELYFGTGDGRLMHLSRQYRNDALEPIDAYWESGAMDFDQDWNRKSSAAVWVTVKPESQARIAVTVQTNRRSDHLKKEVAAGLSTFDNVDFAHWSFRTNRKPQVVRLKLKAKKFVFYKLIFSSCSASATATVLAADLAVRYTGNTR